MTEEGSPVLMCDLDETLVQSTDNADYALTRGWDFGIDFGADCIAERYWSVKIRPGMLDMLDHVSCMFELHLCSLGSRDYVNAVLKHIDPKGRLFGDRVTAREDLGEGKTKFSHIDPSRLVILDDLISVWPEHLRDNIITVIPCMHSLRFYC
jgi:TFIIF-interacting CTD phosphatase-like protein